jgi:hypothetical protein
MLNFLSTHISACQSSSLPRLVMALNKSCCDKSVWLFRKRGENNVKVNLKNIEFSGLKIGPIAGSCVYGIERPCLSETDNLLTS